MKIEIVNNLNNDDKRQINKEEDNSKIVDEVDDSVEDSFESADELDDEYCDDYENFGDDECIKYEPKELIDILEDDFSDSIKKRGEDYYINNHVFPVYKNNDIFFCKVLGHDDKMYVVFIDSKDDIEYHCTCPCEYPCKHVYAALLAIHNLEYKEVNLLPEPDKEQLDLEDLFDIIDGEELREYLKYNVKSNDLDFDRDDFDKYFYKYLPNQKYEYYYNKLHNSLMLDNDGIIDDYLEEINLCISNKRFEEAFKILRCILEVYADLNKLSDYNFVKNIPILRMYLNIIYKSSDKELLETIYAWLRKVELNNCYGSSYVKYLVSSFI